MGPRRSPQHRRRLLPHHARPHHPHEARRRSRRPARDPSTRCAPQVGGPRAIYGGCVMRARGRGYFQSHEACDVLSNFAAAGDWSVAERAFAAVLAVGEGAYLELTRGEPAVAAAAAFAQKRNGFAATESPEFMGIISRLPPAPPTLAQLALRSLARVRG